MIRVGIIGFGRHMKSKLIPAMQAITNIKLVAGSRRNSSLLIQEQEDYKLEYITTNWREMMTRELIDAVVVAGPPQLHTEVAEAAIKAGIHVFTEKPLTLSYEDRMRLKKLNDKHPEVVTAVGYNLQYMDFVDIFKTPKLENLESLRMFTGASGPQSTLWALTVQESFLYSVLIHAISVLHYLKGSPVDIVVHSFEMNRLESDESNVEQISGVLELIYRDRFKVLLEFKNHFEKFIFRIDKSGTDDDLELIDASSGTNNKTLSYLNELKAFFSAIQNSSTERMRNSISDSLPVHADLMLINHAISEHEKRLAIKGLIAQGNAIALLNISTNESGREYLHGPGDVVIDESQKVGCW